MKLVVSMVCTGLAAFLAVQAVQAQQLQTPDVQTTISGNDTATIHPWAIAVDEGGNIYSTDWLIGSVRINTPYGGGYTSALASIGDHMLDFPKAVAIDPAGHLFVGGTSVVTEFEPRSTNNYSAMASIGSGVLDDPYGVAVGPHGDVFVADPGNLTVRRFTPQTDGSYVEQDSVASGAYFYDVAVDPAGNVFVTNTFAHKVLVYRRDGNGYPANPDVVLDAGSGSLYSASLDRYGNVYAADHEGERIVKFTTDGQGGYSGPQLLANVGEGTTFLPLYVAVDRMLNVYVSLGDAYSGILVKIGDRIFADGME